MVRRILFKHQDNRCQFLIGLWILALMVLRTGTVIAEGGFKYFRNYSKKDYDHHAQNWCITQDADGIIFVGNLGGVLEYDGVSWRLIEVTHLTALALTSDPSGTIYVGGSNELGFLSPDPTGNLRYESLLNRLEEKPLDFGDIKQAFAAPDGIIYFRAANFLFRWDGDSQQFKKTLISADGFKAAYFYWGKLYVQQTKAGLQVFEKDSFIDIPGGSFFKDNKINMMVPLDPQSQTFLIGTRAAGLYLYDGARVTPFPTQADDLFKQQRNLLHGIRLVSGDFALATDGAGVIIIDTSGNMKHRYDTSSGLIDDNVKYLYQEPGGNLWLALNNGISKIEYESPFTIYDDRFKLPGTVLSFVKHGSSGTYYAGTTEGLFTLSPHDSFQPVERLSRICWSLLSHDDSLIAATDNGVFVIQNHTLSSICDKNAFCLVHSKKDPNHVWAGANNALVSFVKNNSSGRWEESSISLNASGFVQSIAEEPDGTLWLGTSTQGVFSVSFPNAPDPDITPYGGADGLPVEQDKTLGEINVARIANHTVFATQHGLYRFDKSNGRFIPDSLLGKDFFTGDPGGGKPIFRILEDSVGNIWFHSNSVSYEAILQPDHTYRIENTSLLRIPFVQVNSFYPEPGAVWFCTNDGLIRYDTTFGFKEPGSFTCSIRRVERIDDKTTIYAGHRRDPVNRPLPPQPVLPYENRNLRFFFAAHFYQDESATVYSYFLKGYDRDWSPWSSEARKDYTNLHEGNYTFFVKARNIYKKESSPVSYSFKILPPWYRTTLAYIFYFIVFGFAFFGAIKFRYRRLEYEKKHLEVIVQQRTHEIKEKNLQLEEQTRLLTLQSEQLKEMDKVKSRFFANISHEFRTPLTLIMGPLEQILSYSPDLELKNKAQLMLRNSQRLLGLINQLLDLSRLDSGKMRLQVMRINIIPFLRGIMASFQLLSQQRQIQFLFTHSKRIYPSISTPKTLSR